MLWNLKVSEFRVSTGKGQNFRAKDSKSKIIANYYIGASFCSRVFPCLMLFIFSLFSQLSTMSCWPLTRRTSTQATYQVCQAFHIDSPSKNNVLGKWEWYPVPLQWNPLHIPLIQFFLPTVKVHGLTCTWRTGDLSHLHTIPSLPSMMIAVQSITTRSVLQPLISKVSIP